MLLYNVIPHLFASQFLMTFCFTSVLALIIVAIQRKAHKKLLFFSLCAGILLTLLSFLNTQGDFGGSLYHERLGWPLAMYSINRNVEPTNDLLPAIPFDENFNLAKVAANFVYLSLLSFVIFSGIQNLKKNQPTQIMLSAVIILLAIASPVWLSLSNRPKVASAETETLMQVESDSTTESDDPFPQETAKAILLTQNPDIAKGIEGGLPPQLLYFSRRDDSWYVVHTLEGSGIDQIFEAHCYQVTADENVFSVGQYKYEPYMSYILQDINHIDEETCRIRE